MTRLLGRGCLGRGMILMEMAHCSEAFPEGATSWRLSTDRCPEAGTTGLLSRGDLSGVARVPLRNRTWEWVFLQHRSPAGRVFSLLHNVTFISWARFPFMILGRHSEIYVCGGSFKKVSLQLISCLRFPFKNTPPLSRLGICCLICPCISEEGSSLFLCQVICPPVPLTWPFLTSHRAFSSPWFSLKPSQSLSSPAQGKALEHYHIGDGVLVGE